MTIQEMALEISELETPRKWTDKIYWDSIVKKWTQKLEKFIEENK